MDSPLHHKKKQKTKKLTVQFSLGKKLGLFVNIIFILLNTFPVEKFLYILSIGIFGQVEILWKDKHMGPGVAAVINQNAWWFSLFVAV